MHGSKLFLNAYNASLNVFKNGVTNAGVAAKISIVTGANTDT